MPDHGKQVDVAAPTFMVRNIEELVSMAQWPRATLAEEDVVEPAEIDELDSIRALREFVLETTVDRSIYRSAT